MDELSQQLSELNQVATQLYDYVEANAFRITRRKLLILEILLFVDKNINAVFKLLDSEPRYVDGAEMILRSVYDLSTTGDWIFKARKNTNLWRWIRDDRKTLHQQLNSLVNLMNANPKLANKQYPLKMWQNRLQEVDKDLANSSRKAGASVNDKTISTFNKAKSLGQKSQRNYHTVFWLFSTKTHASPAGLQDLITLNPLKLRRRDTVLPQNEETHATMLMKTALLWYSAHVYNVAKYLNTPQQNEAHRLRDKQLGRS